MSPPTLVSSLIANGNRRRGTGYLSQKALTNPFLLCPLFCCIMTLVSAGEQSFISRDQCLKWINSYELHKLEPSTFGDVESPIRVGGSFICRAKKDFSTQFATTNHTHYDLGKFVSMKKRRDLDIGSEIARDKHSNATEVGCSLFSDPSNLISEFELATTADTGCLHFWVPISFDVNPLNPNAIIVARAAEENTGISDLAVCRYKDENAVEHLGRMFMTGHYFGHCGVIVDGEEMLIGGGYESMSAWPTLEDGTEADAFVRETDREKLIRNIRDRVETFLTTEDRYLVSKISGHHFDKLMKSLEDEKIIATKTLALVLSTKRFIPHELNSLGLSMLRSILSERMTNARRRLLGLDAHPDTTIWERNGLLLKDFDYYADPRNEAEFRELLQMCAAVGPDGIPSNIQWVEKNVTASNTDPQTQAHIDTFHSVVKMWVYEYGVVTEESGPLHVMRGSSRNSEAKLRWIYNVTVPPAIEAIKEPSLRYKGNLNEDGIPSALSPSLPLLEYRQMLIIADTSVFIIMR